MRGCSGHKARVPFMMKSKATSPSPTPDCRFHPIDDCSYDGRLDSPTTVMPCKNYSITITGSSRGERVWPIDCLTDFVYSPPHLPSLPLPSFLPPDRKGKWKSPRIKKFLKINLFGFCSFYKNTNCNDIFVQHLSWSVVRQLRLVSTKVSEQ